MFYLSEFKAFIFDLDDTLISEEKYTKSGFLEVAKKINEDTSHEIADVFSLLCSEHERNTKNVFNRALDFLNIKYNDDYIHELVHCYRNHHPKIELLNDADYILNYLFQKKYKLGIITDGYKESQREKLQALPLLSYFDYVIVTDELGGKEYWKPHTKPFIKMKEKLDVNFKDMVYIGDNITKDFLAPNQLGIYTIMVCRKGSTYPKIRVENDYKPQMEIKSLKYLEKLMRVEEFTH